MAFLLIPLILCGGVFGYVVSDDYVPDVTARVARISFLSGDAQIRRDGSKEWERVTQNLPIVEGDEITTDSSARLEIQLDSYNHLRLNGNSYLRIVTLKDEGVALSIPQGTLSLRVSDFDKSKTYFEVDAPKTTVAVQRAGLYRVDAGNDNDKQVRVTVTEDGEARVYSENSDFTLRNGRSSAINIDGDLAGEWETAEAARFADDFDSWGLEREVVIAKSLKDAYYDKYYDRDIYGAEDLNDYGEWIHTNKYGYVWRPYGNSINRYSSWSPYRYGEWRWIPPFGWTWVNDEPWGWATYHHGRWFYDDGFWYWSPYGYYRNTRSWWSPALVVITIVDSNVCWYPLPYNYAYYNYNYYYGGGHHHGHHDGDRNPPVRGPQPSPTPAPGAKPVTGRGRMDSMPYFRVPVGGVVTVAENDFGTGKAAHKTAPEETAKAVLSKNPADVSVIPRLPKIGDMDARIGGRIRVEKPIAKVAETNIKTGASNRQAKGALDDELRTTRVMGRRPPIQVKTEDRPVMPMEKGGGTLRDTGAVGRPVIKTDSDGSPVKSIPRYEQPIRPVLPKIEQPRNDTPRKSVEPREHAPKTEQPRYNPPAKSVEPRRDPPKIEQPRSEPLKREVPRYEPPPRQTPRNDPPPKRGDPPAPRVQPRGDKKPAPEKGKDG